jgi:hypothetical protein
MSLISLEVRDVNLPGKLLGWVEVPERETYDGARLLVRVLMKPTLDRDLLDPLAPVKVDLYEFPIRRVVLMEEGWAQPRLVVSAEGHEADELYELLRRWSFRKAWGA